MNLLYALKVHNISSGALTFSALNYTVTGNINHYDAVLQAWLSTTITPESDYWEASALNASPHSVSQDVTGLSGAPFTIAAGATKYVLITANINADGFINDTMQVTAISLTFTTAAVQHQLQTSGRIITITA